MILEILKKEINNFHYFYGEYAWNDVLSVSQLIIVVDIVGALLVLTYAWSSKPFPSAATKHVPTASPRYEAWYNVEALRLKNVNDDDDVISKYGRMKKMQKILYFLQIHFYIKIFFFITYFVAFHLLHFICFIFHFAKFLKWYTCLGMRVHCEKGRYSWTKNADILGLKQIMQTFEYISSSKAGEILSFRFSEKKQEVFFIKFNFLYSYTKKRRISYESV